MSVCLFLFCKYVPLYHFLDSTYKWYCMIFVSVWLTSLSMIITRSIHVVASGIISLFFIAEQYSIVDMYPVFFIHSSVDGYLGCFNVLAIVNSAAVNLGNRIIFLNFSKWCVTLLYHSVQFSRSVMSDSLRPHESQHSRSPCPSPTPRVHPDSRP